jgi:hypothetical protein
VSRVLIAQSGERLHGARHRLTPGRYFEHGVDKGFIVRHWQQRSIEIKPAP